MPFYCTNTNVFSSDLLFEKLDDEMKNINANINEKYYFKNLEGTLLNATGVFQRIYYSLTLRKDGEKDSTSKFIPLFLGKHSYDFMMLLLYIFSSKARIGIICPNNFKEDYIKTKNNLDKDSPLKEILDNCNLIILEDLTENNDKELYISNFNLIKILSKIDMIIINPVELKHLTDEQINCMIGNGKINYIDIDGNVKEFNGNKLLSLAFSHKENCILDKYMKLNWEIYYPYM